MLDRNVKPFMQRTTIHPGSREMGCHVGIRRAYLLMQMDLEIIGSTERPCTSVKNPELDS